MVDDDTVDELAEQVSKVTIENLTEDQQKVLEKLQEIQNRHNDVEKEYITALMALKKSFRVKFSPLYEERKEALIPRNDATTAIPNFWCGALKNHQMIADMIETVDEQPLSYLQDIQAKWVEVSENSDKNGFELHFKFAENPYFEPQELVKTYYMETTEDDNDPVLCSTDATLIQWKPSRDITKKTVTRKQKNKRTKQIRKLTETVSVPSFFNFFTKHEIPSEEELDNMSEEQVEELEVVIEADYEAGCIIRDKILPRAVHWFTGDVVDSDMEMDDDDLDDDDDQEELENDDE